MVIADESAHAKRKRKTLHDLNPRLLAATSNPEAVEDEGMVRRAAYLYDHALASIRNELNRPHPSRETVFSLAENALTHDLDSGEEMRGEHISLRMCVYILQDRFLDLAYIVDAAADGEDVLAQAHHRVQRAYAGITLR
jgi:hypothetical protein